MAYINKSDLVAEIERRKQDAINACGGFKSMKEHECNSCIVGQYEEIKEIIDTLEVKEPYALWIQYPSIEDGIKAYAEVYSHNIESQLFNQLTKEQQVLWRKEIEQACISGGEVGVELATDPRYRENLEVNEVDLEKETDEQI